MTGCPNATQRTRHASVTGRMAPTLPVCRSPLQRVTGQQQRSNLVVGDLWPLLEEVADGIEGLGRGQADELVDLRSQPFRRVRRGDRHGQHHPATTTPSSSTAPMASSALPGAPSLRTGQIDSGRCSSTAMALATTTPPRGMPRTTVSGASRWRCSAAARRSPASTRSRKITQTYNRSMSSAAASMPGIGDQAPDFNLPGTPDGDPVALSSFRGSKHVLLCFYVFDFSPG